MDSSWLSRYLSAWTRHAEGGGSDGESVLQELLSFAAEDIRYEDVPTGAVFTGHDGMRKVCRGAHLMASDMTFEVLQQVAGPTGYAFEVVCRGTNTGALGPLPGSGKPFSYRTVSIGEVVDGKVVSQRDYWDLGAFLAQVQD